MMCASGGFFSARMNPTICLPSSATRQSAAGKLKKYCSDHLLYAIPGGKHVWSSLYIAAKSRASYCRIASPAIAGQSYHALGVRQPCCRFYGFCATRIPPIHTSLPSHMGAPLLRPISAKSKMIFLPRDGPQPLGLDTTLAIDYKLPAAL